MYYWPKMKNSKRSFHAKVRKVVISPILIRGSFKRFEDSDFDCRVSIAVTNANYINRIVSVINSVTGVAANTVEEIHQASLNYCVDLLANQEPTKDFESVIALKKSVHVLKISQRENYDEH